MKKILAITVILLVVIGTYMYTKRSSKEGEVATDIQTIQEQPTTGKKIAFTRFVEQGGQYECTVNQYIQDQMYTGKVRIKDGDVKGEYDIESGSQTMHVSFIAKDGYSYTWSNIGNTGFKSPMRIDEDMNERGDITGTYAWSAQQIGDYNCTEATVSDAEFDVPANITFKEISGTPVLN